MNSICFAAPCIYDIWPHSLTRKVYGSQRAASGFTRLMIEKPFGRDSPTFDALSALTSRHFSENQLFRLDHYLGKEVL